MEHGYGAAALIYAREYGPLECTKLLMAAAVPSENAAPIATAKETVEEGAAAEETAAAAEEAVAKKAKEEKASEISLGNHLVGEVVKVSGCIALIDGLNDLFEGELVNVGEDTLCEVVQAGAEGGTAAVQLLEGPHPRTGDTATRTGRVLSIELGPGLMASYFDELQYSVAYNEESMFKGTELVFDDGSEEANKLLQGHRHPTIPTFSRTGEKGLPRNVLWQFTPAEAIVEGAFILVGDFYGTVPEGSIEHRLMCEVSGTVHWISPKVECTLDDTVLQLLLEDGCIKDVKMYTVWPVRKIRPTSADLPLDTLLATGKRVLDVIVPAARGGTVALGSSRRGVWPLVQVRNRGNAMNPNQFLRQSHPSMQERYRAEPQKYGADSKFDHVKIVNGSNSPFMNGGSISDLGADVYVYLGCGGPGSQNATSVDNVCCTWPHGLPAGELPRDADNHDRKLSKTCVVFSADNASPPAKEIGVLSGLVIAEYYRDMGHSVALTVDSLLHYGSALYQISNDLGLVGQAVHDSSQSTSRIADAVNTLYGRAGNYGLISSSVRTGSLTILGSVAEPLDEWCVELAGTPQATAAIFNRRGCSSVRVTASTPCEMQLFTSRNAAQLTLCVWLCDNERAIPMGIDGQRLLSISRLGTNIVSKVLRYISSCIPDISDVDLVVTRAAIQTVGTYWSTDHSRAIRKCFPNIHPTRSWSKHKELIQSCYRAADLVQPFTTTTPELIFERAAQISILPQYKAAGVNGLDISDQIIHRMDRQFDWDFLQQNSFTTYDNVCSLRKSLLMNDNFMLFVDKLMTHKENQEVMNLRTAREIHDSLEKQEINDLYKELTEMKYEEDPKLEALLALRTKIQEFKPF